MSISSAYGPVQDVSTNSPVSVIVYVGGPGELMIMQPSDLVCVVNMSQGVNQDWDLSVCVWSRCMCENAARCDHVTGDCHCSPGWTGEDCSQTCRPGHWGVDCRRVNMVQLFIASQISSTRIDFGMSFTAYRDIPFLSVSLLCAQS